MPDDPMEDEHPELVWVRNIPEQFGVSADVIYEAFDAGKVQKVTFPGNKRTYFVRDEVRKYLNTPRYESKYPDTQANRVIQEWRREE